MMSNFIESFKKVLTTRSRIQENRSIFHIIFHYSNCFPFGYTWNEFENNFFLKNSVYSLISSEGRQSVYFQTWHVFPMQALGVSTLCRDSDCLLCAVISSHIEDKVSTLWLHTDCLLSDGMCLHYDGIPSAVNISP